MVNPDIAYLRSKLDLEGKYVDFALLREWLSVEQVAFGLGIELSKKDNQSSDSERRGRCLKCHKDRSFSLNINTNRFKCFTKGCNLKGGGVIDFYSKLYDVTAREAAHFLAIHYDIRPYDSEIIEASKFKKKTVSENKPPAVPNKQPDQSREVVSRAEFDALTEKVERLNGILKVLAPTFFLNETSETEKILSGGA